MRRRAWIAGLAMAAATGWAGFTAYKTRAVAAELVDPPFYRPQPIPVVDQTYAELAKGESSDPGGTWSSEQVDGLQLWTLRRAQPAKGIVLLLHGFGDDRWGTSPALKWFPGLDAAIFTYRRRDDALRTGGPVPPVTFGARESEEVVRLVRHLEVRGWRRNQILLMGRSLGASVGLLALVRLESDSRGPLAGIIWEGAPASSRSFGEALVRGPANRLWHPFVAPLAGKFGSALAARRGGYEVRETDVLERMGGRTYLTPALCFLATEDRLASPQAQRKMADRFNTVRLLEIPTWHLNCSAVLGPHYAKAIQAFTEDVLKGEGSEH
ncbi:MAG: hypothetical protein IPQ13_03235 [Holophagaceae bacterium]|nr:hypothetical protein [Holophagaceae bacterium]